MGRISTISTIFRRESTTPLQPYPVSMDPVVPDAVVAFPVNTGSAVSWIRLRSGTASTPVKQAADRVFQIVVEDADATGTGGTGAQGPTGPAGADGAAGPKGATGPLVRWDHRGLRGRQGRLVPLVFASYTGRNGSDRRLYASGNIITQWGSFAASTSGVTVNFPKPYVDGVPSVTASAAAGGVLQVSATKTTLTISCNSGTPTVSWKAIGS